MADSKRVVYIIDDDPSVRCGFKRLMAAGGYDARVFASAREFLTAGLPAVLSAPARNTACSAVGRQPMQAGIPADNSCLIIDVAMPEMDGLQLQKELVRRGCQAPIIFITALENPQVQERAKRAGAAGFFQKPVDADDLLDAVKCTLPAEAKSAI